MATRVFTARFLTLRSECHAARAIDAAKRVEKAASSLATFGQSDVDSKQLESNRPTMLDKPVWVTISEDVSADVKKIKDNLRSLQKLHAIRLQVDFDDAKTVDQQLAIDELTRDLTQRLRSCESGIKKIGLIGNDGSLTAQEKTTRLNIMRSLGTDLQLASKQFKSIQRDFFTNLQNQDAVGNHFNISSASGGAAVSLDDAVNQRDGLTANQVSELALMESNANDRERAIIRLAQSVNELAVLFKELNQLVIEQGTVLDRIDYNVSASLEKIKKGVVDLEAAEKSSKQALTMKCVAILAIVCIMLLIVFIWKKSS